MSADYPTAEPPVHALNALIRRASAPAAIRDDLDAWLTEQGVTGQDHAAMTAVGAERWLVYRTLVHSRMRNTIRDFIPRTTARLGLPYYRALMDTFMDVRATSSPYLRDVPQEFVDWAVPRLTADPDIPNYLACLARHELLQFDVRNDPGGGEAETGKPLALDRPLRFDGAARRIDYAYAVHKLPPAKDDRTEPERVPTSLLVYRDKTGKPRYLELIPFAATLLDRMIGEGDALQPALLAACASLDVPLDDARLGEAAVLLADLADRHVMLGAQ